VSALFTAGNILEGSYKEEFIDYGDATQDLIATVIYRDTEVEDVFPRDASVQVSLRGVKEDVAIRQTFDISQYVSKQGAGHSLWPVALQPAAMDSEGH
jgi:hypothetical protein